MKTFLDSELYGVVQRYHCDDSGAGKQEPILTICGTRDNAIEKLKQIVNNYFFRDDEGSVTITKLSELMFRIEYLVEGYDWTQVVSVKPLDNTVLRHFSFSTPLN